MCRDPDGNKENTMSNLVIAQDLSGSQNQEQFKTAVKDSSNISEISCDSDESAISHDNLTQFDDLNVQFTKLRNDFDDALAQMRRLEQWVESLRKKINNCRMSKIKETSTTSTKLVEQRHKICIISSANTYNIPEIIENLDLDRRYDYCHYIKNGADALQLLEGLNLKLKDFNSSDYCVILLGESDFYQQKDFKALIREMRKYLQDIIHTNIIVVPPTYICGAPIFNYKVEVFNRALYNDATEHQHIHMFDSNRDLTYTMFSMRTGKLNKIGMRTIFSNIQKLIKDIQNEAIFFRSPTLYLLHLK